MTRFLILLCLLVPGLATAESIVKKGSTTWTFPPGVAVDVEKGSVLVTIPDYDEVNLKRDVTSPPVPSNPPTPNPAHPTDLTGLVAAPAFGTQFPLAGEQFKVFTLDLSTPAKASQAIYAANQKARAEIPNGVAIFEGNGTVRQAGVANVIDHPNVIIRPSPGGSLTFDCSGLWSWWQAKACILLYGENSRYVLENVTVSGRPDHNENTAGIYLQRAGVLVLRHVKVTGADFGLLTGTGTKLTTVVIEDSEFWDNGSGDDKTHNIYVNGGRAFVKGLRSWYTGNGATATGVHALKLRVSDALVIDSELTAGRGAAYDQPYGGQLVMERTKLIRSGGGGGNVVMMGAEMWDSAGLCSRGHGPMTLRDVEIINERQGTAYVNNYCGNELTMTGKFPSSLQVTKQNAKP